MRTSVIALLVAGGAALAMVAAVLLVRAGGWLPLAWVAVPKKPSVTTLPAPVATGSSRVTLAGVLPGHLSGHGRMTLCFSPDGKMLVVTSATTSSVGGRGQLKVWDVRRRKVLFAAERDGVFDAAVFTPDGHGLIATASARTLLWRVGSWALVRAFPSGGDNGLAVSPDGRLLAAVTHTVHVFEIDTGRAIRQIKGACWDLAFSPDGKLLAISHGESISLWNTTNWREEIWRVPRKAGNHTYEPVVGELRFSPDGRLLFTSYHRGQLWDVGTRKIVRALRDSPGVRKAHFSADGKTLAALRDFGEEVVVWNVASGEVVVSFKPGYEHRANSFAFSPDGRMLATGTDWDPRVILWTLK